MSNKNVICIFGRIKSYFFLLKLGIITYQQYLVVRVEMSDPGQLRQPCRTQAI